MHRDMIDSLRKLQDQVREATEATQRSVDPDVVSFRDMLSTFYDQLYWTERRWLFGNRDHMKAPEGLLPE